MKQGIPSIMVAKGGFAYDPDAQALFDAAQITDDTVKTAVNNLIIAAKANGWWTLCDILYGFAGDGVSQTYESQYKYNWKDPQDTDAAYRLSFTGGITFASTGMVGNGTTGFADTHFVPSTVLSTFDTHFSYYSRTNVQEESADMGVIDALADPRMNLHLKWSDGNVYSDQYQAATRIATANASSAGYFLDSREANNSHIIYKNGSSLGSNSTTDTGSPPTTISVYLLATNFGGVASFFSTRETAFMTMGAKINSTMQATMDSDIQAYQTALSRNV